MRNFFYRVKQGDTVISLSKKFSVPIGVLIYENNLKRDVFEGDVLFVPKMMGKPYIIKANDNAKTLAKEFCVSEEELLYKNKSPYFFYGEIIYI